MSNSTARNTDVFTISLPTELAEQVRRTAKAEDRSVSELFRECYRAYRQKRFRETFEASHEAFREWAKENNLSEEQMREEVEQAIRDVKGERRGRGQKVNVAG